jgi:hypothetical protein
LDTDEVTEGKKDEDGADAAVGDDAGVEDMGGDGLTGGRICGLEAG